MPVSCCVIDCTNRCDGKTKVSFHRIPKETEKRRLWLNAIKRKGWEPNDHARVCGRHFVNGKKHDDRLHVDYVPSLHMGYTNNSNPPTPSVNRYDRYKQREENIIARENRSIAANILLEFSQTTCRSNNFSDENIPCENTSVHDNCLKTISELKADNNRLLMELQRLQAERDSLIEQNKKLKFGVDSIKDSDTKTKSFTGLPSYAVFAWILSYISSVLPGKTAIDPGNILLLVLMKLRLNLLNFDLASRFHVSETVVSDILNASLPVIAGKLKFLIHWPNKEDIIRTTPQIVKEHFKNCRCIIDCTEIFIDRPGNLTARATTWSNYKHNNTVKLLVGINPCGAISFLSKVFGGRTSDKVITQRSGFLDLLEHGDVILADRGFLIADELASRSATLAIPAFTRGQSQLSQKDIEKTRYLARIRIHVERAIGRLKSFKAISSVMPMNMVPHVDSIVVICAAICNLQPSLIV